MESSGYTLHTIAEGYSEMIEGGNKMRANCSCVVLKGPMNIIIDTMTSWDKELIIEGLDYLQLTPEDISYVISTHGHSDHIGNNNLFLEALHIVGFSISEKDIYHLFSFQSGDEYTIDEWIRVVPTPGHTLEDVSVIATTENYGRVAVVGDLFENESDIFNSELWLEAGSNSASLQRKHRHLVARQVDWIVPGHGHMFKVDNDIRESLRQQIENNNI